ncbi:unnamed protein product, partial [Prorocentrum cordatum]
AQEQAAGDELTDSRVRVRGALEEALGDGSLEQLLRSRQRERDDAEAAAKAEENITAEDLAPEGGGGGGEAAEADDAVEEVRGLARSLLLGGLSEGTLEAALRDVAGEAQQPASSEAPLQESGRRRGPPPRRRRWRPCRCRARWPPCWGPWPRPTARSGPSRPPSARWRSCSSAARRPARSSRGRCRSPATTPPAWSRSVELHRSILEEQDPMLSG